MPWIKQYTDEQEDFLRQYPSLCRKELAEKFNARFGTSKSVEAIRNHCRRRLGMRMPRLTTFGGDCVPWNKGMKGWHAKGAEKGWFKKGNVMNKYDVGTEHKKAGITHVKYTDEHKESRKNFAPKHHVVWEKHNGKRPPSHVVVFKDGNKDNCVIENLELIPRGLFMTLTKIGWSNEPQELKPTIKAMVELQAEMKKAMDKKFAT